MTRFKNGSGDGIQNENGKMVESFCNRARAVIDKGALQ
jgi:hypothetical protein